MTDHVVETASGPVSLERHGSGPDLVMLHSLLSDRHVFDRVVPALAERRTVTLVDLPGFGATPVVDPDIGSYAAVVGALLHDGGFDPATTAVLGNGLGAFVALATAVRHGDAFERLVLAGCGASFDDQSRATFRGMAAAARDRGMGAVVEQGIRRIFTEPYLEAHPDEADERRGVLGATDPDAFARACTALSVLDERAGAALLTMPTLVVVGAEDSATPPELGSDLADLIPGARFELLEGVAHAPQLQDPEGFLAVVLPFLEGE